MKERFSFANQKHLNVFVGLLCVTGAMCAKCGHGTRKTSKRWARCKKCGERVARVPLSEIRVEAER